MKIWSGYGSEHSASLVMIGTFKDATEADQVKVKFDLLTEQVQKESGGHPDNTPSGRFSDEMLKVLEKVRFHTVAPSELEQFLYDFQLKVKDNQIILNTDEVEISVFLKLLIDNGAKVELYSTHTHPDEPQ